MPISNMPRYAAHAGGHRAGRATAAGLLHGQAALRTWAEKLLIPAFIWFFMMLYPFNWVNRKGPVSGAAGGCVLVERSGSGRGGRHCGDARRADR
jgi:hypothetical protein